jgi:hypothetical protein
LPAWIGVTVLLAIIISIIPSHKVRIIVLTLFSPLIIAKLLKLNLDITENLTPLPRFIVASKNNTGLLAFGAINTLAVLYQNGLQRQMNFLGHLDKPFLKSLYAVLYFGIPITVGLFSWFVIPLIGLQGRSLFDALRLSIRAFYKNLLVLGLVLILFIIAYTTSVAAILFLGGKDFVTATLIITSVLCGPFYIGAQLQCYQQIFQQKK